MNYQLISQEDFTSVQEVQAGTTKVFEKARRNGTFMRVMRNQKPLGVLIPNDMWEDLLENLEASLSPNYLKRIAEARKSKEWVSSKEAKKMLGIK